MTQTKNIGRQHSTSSIPPLIGITTYAQNENGEFTLPDNYIHSVRRARGIPVLIAPGESNVETLVDRLDGMVLAGGGDMCPSCYDGAEHETVYAVDDERDKMELSLVEHLLRKDLPTLAICRGIQVVNVHLGGPCILTCRTLWANRWPIVLRRANRLHTISRWSPLPRQLR